MSRKQKSTYNGRWEELDQENIQDHEANETVCTAAAQKWNESTYPMFNPVNIGTIASDDTEQKDGMPWESLDPDQIVAEECHQDQQLRTEEEILAAEEGAKALERHNKQMARDNEVIDEIHKHLFEPTLKKVWPREESELPRVSEEEPTTEFVRCIKQEYAEEKAKKEAKEKARQAMKKRAELIKPASQCQCGIQ